MDKNVKETSVESENPICKIVKTIYPYFFYISTKVVTFKYTFFADCY